MARREHVIVQEVIDRIRQAGGHARKVHGGPHQQAGEPDVDACVEGRAVKVEVKVPGAKPSAAQIGALRRWERSGALVGWVTSLRELEALLARVGDPHWTNPQVCRHLSTANGGGRCDRCGAAPGDERLT